MNEQELKIRNEKVREILEIIYNDGVDDGCIQASGGDTIRNTSLMEDSLFKLNDLYLQQSQQGLVGEEEIYNILISKLPMKEYLSIASNNLKDVAHAIASLGICKIPSVEEIAKLIEIKINQLWETNGINTWKLDEEGKYKRTAQAIHDLIGEKEWKSGN